MAKLDEMGVQPGRVVFTTLLRHLPPGQARMDMYNLWKQSRQAVRQDVASRTVELAFEDAYKSAGDAQYWSTVASKMTPTQVMELFHSFPQKDDGFIWAVLRVLVHHKCWKDVASVLQTVRDWPLFPLFERWCRHVQYKKVY
jgi:hypothetical protein